MMRELGFCDVGGWLVVGWWMTARNLVMAGHGQDGIRRVQQWLGSVTDGRGRGGSVSQALRRLREKA